MNIMRILVSDWNEAVVAIVVIVSLLVLFGAIIGIVIYVKRHNKKFGIEEEKVDEQQAVQQELDRILVPIDDEEIQKEMAKKEEKDD